MLNDPVLPAVFTATDARRAGMSRGQVDRRVSTGHWLRLRRGVFCLTAVWEGSTPQQQHLLLAGSVVAARSGVGSVALSHTTAAALLDLPVPPKALDAVHLTVAPGSGEHSRRRGDIHQHVADLVTSEIRELRGLPVTFPDRTVADCLRLLDPYDGVPIADAALHHRLTSVEAVQAMLERQTRWPRVEIARAALTLSDPRRETPLESRSVVVMHRYRLPPPVPQVKIFDGRGRFVARVDFAWLRRGVVGEADGRVKYADGDAVAVIEAEKDRQARLEAMGLVVVRWGWRHLEGNPPLLVTRVRDALARGDASRFTGRTAA